MSLNFTKETLNLLENSLGKPQELSIYTLTWNRPGPHVFICASVHGAEVQGNLVIYELMKWAKDNSFNGKLTLVPQANPEAQAHKLGTQTYGRFNPVTGHNWNRNYHELGEHGLSDFVSKNLSSTPDQIAQNFKHCLAQELEALETKFALYGKRQNGHLNLQLQKLAAQNDIVLDLHTGPVACRYLYVPEYLKEHFRYLNIPHNIIIPHDFAGAFDEACFTPWVKLHQAFKDQGIELPILFESYTVELGSEERVSKKEALFDLENILNYLRFKGVVSGNPQSTQALSYAPLSHFKTYYAPSGGLCEYLLPPGSSFKKGQLLAQITNMDKLQNLEDLEHCLIEVFAKTDGILINHCPSAIVAQGMELIQVLENTSNLKSL